MGEEVGLWLPFVVASVFSLGSGVFGLFFGFVFCALCCVLLLFFLWLGCWLVLCEASCDG